MITRRQWLSALIGAAGAAAVSSGAQARDVVSFVGNYAPGSIVVITHRRELYYTIGGGQAVRYPVGVGRAGLAWQGQTVVALKRVRPPWADPDKPLSGVIPPGSPHNPMGAAVLGLAHGNYAIHGTNNPSSIGGFVSAGCIRMYNEDVLDLYQRAGIGTVVHVLR